MQSAYKIMLGMAMFFYSLPPLFAYSGFGVCNHGKETLPSVICDGPAVLKQTTITGNMNVTGKLYAEGLSVSSMTVLGDAELSDSEVNGEVKIVGNLKANQVNFKKGVAVESDKILLNHSVVNGTLIITSAQATPYVQLQCSSAVKGAVFFDGKAGIVQVTGDSAVQGKIINGSTEFVKRSCE
jgi:cytoskeletal protein CcmA (bactofilin family)